MTYLAGLLLFFAGNVETRCSYGQNPCFVGNRFVEAKLRSNDTKFRPTGTKFPNEVSSHAAKIRFDSSYRLRNFATFSSERKVRNLIAEIRVISLISANFVCISFALHSTVLSSYPSEHAKAIE